MGNVETDGSVIPAVSAHDGCNARIEAAPGFPEKKWGFMYLACSTSNDQPQPRKLGSSIHPFWQARRGFSMSGNGMVALQQKGRTTPNELPRFAVRY